MAYATCTTGLNLKPKNSQFLAIQLKTKSKSKQKVKMGLRGEWGKILKAKGSKMGLWVSLGSNSPGQNARSITRVRSNKLKTLLCDGKGPESILRSPRENKELQAKMLRHPVHHKNAHLMWAVRCSWGSHHQGHPPPVSDSPLPYFGFSFLIMCLGSSR